MILDPESQFIENLGRWVPGLDESEDRFEDEGSEICIVRATLQGGEVKLYLENSDKADELADLIRELGSEVEVFRGEDRPDLLHAAVMEMADFLEQIPSANLLERR